MRKIGVRVQWKPLKQVWRPGRKQVTRVLHLAFAFTATQLAYMATKEVNHDVPFHQRLTDAQSSLYAFICSLMGGDSSSRDVLQETNIVLWEKSADYDPTRDFLPWAFRFAHFQVLAYRKRQTRERLLFSDELVELLASDILSEGLLRDDRLDALEVCLSRLDSPRRDLVRAVYEKGKSVEAIGRSMGKNASALYAQLYRIRKALYCCVESVLRSGGCNV
jgi:RNA polymerase sigma-70 factor, ECF subfamily